MIGGGAAGLMAAITAARQGAAVTLLEPNERLGKKVNITGKGRCNVTNDCDRETLLASIPGNGRFLYGALTRFTPRDTMAFFEALGVSLKVERGNRVFPVSDSAFDITNALERELKRRKVRWVRDRAAAVETADGAVCAVTGEKGTYPAQAVILATGGVSYPGTGSTGDGYRIAETLGHTIVPLRGSLVPLVCAGEDCPAMQGLSLRNVAVTVYNGKKKAVFRAGRAEAGRAGAAGYRRKSQPGDGDHRRGAGAPQHGAGGAAPGGADRKRKGQQPDKGTAPGTGAGAEALYAGAYRAAARQ